MKRRRIFRYRREAEPSPRATRTRRRLPRRRRDPLNVPAGGWTETATCNTELAAAVANAGSLGLLGVGPAPAPVMQAMIRATRLLTTRPFGVDLILEETTFGPCTTVQHIEVCEAEQVPVGVLFCT